MDMVGDPPLLFNQLLNSTTGVLEMRARRMLTAMVSSSTVMLYVSSKTITVTTHSTLTTCLMDIKTWMQRNFLKLNCNKSEMTTATVSSTVPRTNPQTLSPTY